jgi:hypothetical protein
VLKQVVAATYLQVWWPHFDRPVFVHRKPQWDGTDYIDVDTGIVLPTWQEALDQAESEEPAMWRGSGSSWTWPASSPRPRTRTGPSGI